MNQLDILAILFRSHYLVTELFAKTGKPVERAWRQIREAAEMAPRFP
jgi:hypothetical protein